MKRIIAVILAITVIAGTFLSAIQAKEPGAALSARRPIEGQWGNRPGGDRGRGPDWDRRGDWGHRPGGGRPGGWSNRPGGWDHGRYDRHDRHRNGAVAGAIIGGVLNSLFDSPSYGQPVRQPVLYCDSYGNCWYQ